MRHYHRYGKCLRWIGHAARALFASLLIATVLCLLADILGMPQTAWSLYTALLPLFWKSGLTLVCLLAITIALSSLE